MECFAREDIREVLESYGINSARRATTTDESEEVVLLEPVDYKKVEVRTLTLAIMEVLPQVKVWVTLMNDRWETEPI